MPILHAPSRRELLLASGVLFAWAHIPRVALAEGRDLAARKKAGEHIFEALSSHLDPMFASSRFALSFEMQINDKETSWKRNNIHEALKAEVAHG